MDRVPTIEQETNEPPLHGYRGDALPSPTRPLGLTVAISREAGARGGSIAKAVSRLLGWQVVDQEMFDFLTSDIAARNDLLAEVPDASRAWAEARFAALVQYRGLDESSPLADVTRLTLTLAARGETVLVGRAAGFLLPPISTVHARIIAPEEQRVAYLGQWLRLTRDEALTELRRRDAARVEVLRELTGRDSGEATDYDLLLNSARLGLEACAELIAQAVRAKQLAVGTNGSLPDQP